MNKNTWMFNIRTLNGNTHLNRLCFYGADSEEAHTNCIEWAEKQYDADCIAELVEGEIERNESRRAQVKMESEWETATKNQISNVLVRKIKTVTKIEEVN